MVPHAKDMLSSLLRPKQPPRRVDSAHLFEPTPNTPSPGQASRDYSERRQRHATADFTEGDDDDDDDDDGDFDLDDRPSGPRVTWPYQETNARRNSASLIPLFSASHLGRFAIVS